MAVNRYKPSRPRPVPASSRAAPRAWTHPAFLVFARWHRAWRAHRTQVQWQRELAALDARMLRDVGLEPADVRRLTQVVKKPAESTIPPQYLPGLAKLAHHLEG